MILSILSTLWNNDQSIMITFSSFAAFWDVDWSVDSTWLLRTFVTLCFADGCYTDWGLIFFLLLWCDKLYNRQITLLNDDCFVGDVDVARRLRLGGLRLFFWITLCPWLASLEGAKFNLSIHIVWVFIHLLLIICSKLWLLSSKICNLFYFFKCTGWIRLLSNNFRLDQKSMSANQITKSCWKFIPRSNTWTYIRQFMFCWHPQQGTNRIISIFLVF